MMEQQAQSDSQIKDADRDAKFKQLVEAVSQLQSLGISDDIYNNN